ncbi:hypothetical protein BDQ17DRAFT_1389496 [Cyathus striatus]|nr:hypothetical protein BDQ17DRAFT_1389496 [Cyathus striatus]
MNLSLAHIPLQNLEEAANIASDFITSLDNLPNEVQHLLYEIKLKETRCQELQHEIEKDQTRYIRHSLKQSSNPPSSAATPGATTTGGGIAPKAHLPGRIATAYSELQVLSGQKLVLAQRIVDLLARKRARLDSDLAKVRILQGEPPEEAIAPVYLKAPSFDTKERLDALGTNIPVAKINDSLHHAIVNTPSIDAAPAASVLPGSHKKRRLNTTTSKIPSPAPVAPATSKAQSRSRASRQAKQRVKDEEMVVDANREEDIGEDDAEDDTTPYCFCRKQSYGDFHLSCVGVKQPLPDKWYCPECTSRGAGNPERRKGRKK